MSPAEVPQRVQPLVVVDNCSFSPTGLTTQMTLRILATQGRLSMLPIFNSEDSDGASCVPVCVPVPGLSPALSRAAVASGLVLSSVGHLRRRGQTDHAPPSAAPPRTPDDCPACRLASPASLRGGSPPLQVRPWSEVKSRRGAPKRIDTAGFACLNRQCRYYRNTDASFHALVGDGKHGKAEHMQRLRCQACRTTFTCPS
jgi:hypothetical protein